MFGQKNINKSIIQISYYPWIVLALVFGAQLSEALVPLGIPLLYPFIQAEFTLSRAQIGFITSSTAFGTLLTALLSGWLIDYFGVKRVMVITLLSTAVVLGLFNFAGSFYILLVLAIFLGITHSPVYPGTTRAIMDWIPGKIRGLSMSLKQTSVPVGGALVAAVLPALALTFGWRLSAAFLGLPILLVAILFLPMYHNPPTTGTVKSRVGFSTLVGLVQNRSLIAATLWGVIFVGLHYTILTYFILFLMEVLHLSPVMAGGLLALAQTASIFSRILWGAVSDFLFHRRRMPVLVIVGFLSTLTLLGMSLLSTGANISVIVTIMLGVFMLSWQGIFTTLIGEMADEGQVGITVGFVNTIMRIAVIILPPLFGYLVDTSGSYELAWQVTALVAFLATLVLLVFSREPQRR